MAPVEADQCQAGRMTHGADFWRSRSTPKYRTRTELQAGRQGNVDPIHLADELGSAGDAPPAMAPAHRIDNNTRVRTPLSTARLKATSQVELLRERKAKGAHEEQERYNKWADANPRQPAHPARADDWVSEPKHSTHSQIQAEKRTKQRQATAPFEDRRPKGLDATTHDPKFDDQARPKTATVAYVEAPPQRTQSSLKKARAADNLRQGERSAHSAKRSAQQRREQIEARSVLKKTGNSKSLSMLKQSRKQSRSDYERNLYTKALAHKEQTRPSAWKDTKESGRAFWQSDKAWVPDPPIGSSAELHVSQRSYLPHEQYNQYSDPASDPFKREYHARKLPATDDDLVTNVAKMVPHADAVYASKLGKIQARDSSFTDYNLYFTICDSLPPPNGDAPSDHDPLYSSFTKNKQFDPNTGLPKHSKLRIAPREPAAEQWEVYETASQEELCTVDEPESLSPDGKPMPSGTCWVPAPERRVLHKSLAAAAECTIEAQESSVQEVAMPKVNPGPSYSPGGVKQFNSNLRAVSAGERRGVSKAVSSRPQTAKESKRSSGAPSLPPGHLWKMRSTQEMRPGTAQVRSSGFQNLVVKK